MSSYHGWDQPLSFDETIGGWGADEAVSVAVAEELSAAEDFAELAEWWQTDTADLSSTTKRIAHPAYQRIIGLGKPVVPVLLRELKVQPNFWFHALRSITGADPVADEDRGSLAAMAVAWVEWGRENGYLEESVMH